MPFLLILARSIIHALFGMSLHRVELRISSSSYVPLAGGMSLAVLTPTLGGCLADSEDESLFYVSVLAYLIYRHLYSGIVVEVQMISR